LIGPFLKAQMGNPCSPHPRHGLTPAHADRPLDGGCTNTCRTRLTNRPGCLCHSESDFEPSRSFNSAQESA